MKIYKSLLLLFMLPLFNINAENDRIILKAESEPDYPPFCIEDEEGQASGFSVELLRAAAEIMGYGIEFQVRPWYIIKENLAAGKIDALPMVGRSPEREALYGFTVPYHKLHGAVFVRAGSEAISDFEDLYGKEILVMKGDNADEYISRTFRDAVITRTETFESAFKLLSEGHADAVIAQKLMGQELLKTLDITNIETLDIVLEGFSQDFSFAVRKGNSKLLADLNEGLVLLISNGTYEKLYKKWFFPDLPDMSYKEIFKAVLPILIPVVFILFLTAVIVLEYGVKVKTASLKTEAAVRVKAESEVIRQLEEKTILLKEVHHRIKNNFASIEAFINLSSSNQTTSEAKTALEIAARRVSSMRILYERLLVTEGYEKHPVSGYSAALLYEIKELYSGKKDITFNTCIGEFDLSANALFYVGIILNELITNSMKYAFIGREKGEIYISISRENHTLRIIVRDDGVGIRKTAASNQTGFGTTIIKMLSQQMNGSYSISDRNGTENVVELSIKE